MRHESPASSHDRGSLIIPQVQHYHYHSAVDARCGYGSEGRDGSGSSVQQEDGACSEAIATTESAVDRLVSDFWRPIGSSVFWPRGTRNW